MQKINVGVTFHFNDNGTDMVTCREVPVCFYHNNNELFHDRNGSEYGKFIYRDNQMVNEVHLSEILAPAGKTLAESERLLKARAATYCIVGGKIAEYAPIINKIWSTDCDELEKDIAENYEDYGYDEVPDNTYEIAAEINGEYLGDEVVNLSGIKGTFVATGEIQRWNGSRHAFKILKAESLGEAIKEVFSSFGGDNTFDAYVENGDVIVAQRGHDNPTNPSVMKIRTIKEELIDGEEFEDVEDLIYGATDEQLDERTNKLGGNVLDVYGVDLETYSDMLSKKSEK